MECGLLIETSTHVCSAGIYCNGKLAAHKIIESETYVHAESLLPCIQEVIQLANVMTTDLDAVVIGEGPGSYTGLRIGTSLAKGICMGLGIPLYAVDSGKMFAAYGKREFPEKKCFVSFSDAGRMEVYMAVYDENLNCLSEHQPVILEETFFHQVELGDAVFVGDGVLKASHWLLDTQRLLVAQADVKMISLVMDTVLLEPRNTAEFVPRYVKTYQPGIAKNKLG